MDNRLFIAKRAARYFKSGDIVNLGVGIPSMCGNYAEPGVMFQTENGFIGVGPVAEGLMMNDGLKNLRRMDVPVGDVIWHYSIRTDGSYCFRCTSGVCRGGFGKLGFSGARFWYGRCNGFV